jgi:hypothetical protein
MAIIKEILTVQFNKSQGLRPCWAKEEMKNEE